jgi:hypothetical protein
VLEGDTGVGKFICFLKGFLGVDVAETEIVLLGVGDAVMGEVVMKDPEDFFLPVLPVNGDGVLGRDIVMEASTSIPSSTLSVVDVHRGRLLEGFCC